MSVNNKTAFITGVAGFLGSHLADNLLAQGWRVAGCDNLLGGYVDNIPNDVEFHEIDCSDLPAMTAAMVGTDVVYHCAATAYEGMSVFSPHLVIRNTIDATTAAISAAVQNNVSRFIYLSSMARYGGNIVPFDESMAPSPVDPYGVGKHAGESVLRTLAEEHGMEYVIAVPHNIYGPRQKYDDPYRNVVAIMINLMLNDRQPIIYGDGSQRRCFSYIEDDVAVLGKLALTTNSEIVNGIVNIGPDEEFITINQLAEEIAGIIGFELDPTFMPARPLEVKDATCSADKARRTLGYKTEFSLHDGLEEMIAWIKDRGPRPFSYHLDLEIVNDRTPRTWKDRLF